MSEGPAKRGTLAAILHSWIVLCLLAGLGIGYLVGRYLDSMVSHSGFVSTTNGLKWGAVVGIIVGLVLDWKFRRF